MDKIIFLGWGSLLWDKQKRFEKYHDSWKSGGPSLKLEFSRISSSRSGALTLVIDPSNGSNTNVSYCISKRSIISEAINDLKIRENTVINNIGVFSKIQQESVYKDEASFKEDAFSNNRSAA